MAITLYDSKNRRTRERCGLLAAELGIPLHLGRV